MKTTYPQPTRIPDGLYVVRIKRLDLGPAKSTGKLRIHYVLEIQEGAFEGKHINKIHMLTTEAAVKQCLKEWSKAGISVASPERLIDHLDSIRNTVYRVTLINEAENQRCFFRGRVAKSFQSGHPRTPPIPDAPNPFPVIGPTGTLELQRL